MKCLSLLLLLLAVGTGSAHAADCTTLASAATPACADAAGAADRDLNASYKALAGTLAPADQTRLRDAQRAWIAFRDKECAFRAAPYQGEPAKTARAQCVGELSAQRATALAHQNTCNAQDAGCVPQASRAQGPAAAVPAAMAKPAGSASGTATLSCRQSVGKTRADTYVKQCIAVSPATHPPCNAANACELITDEIARGCGFIGAGAPAYCKDYPPR